MDQDYMLINNERKSPIKAKITFECGRLTVESLELNEILFVFPINYCNYKINDQNMSVTITHEKTKQKILFQELKYFLLWKKNFELQKKICSPCLFGTTIPDVCSKRNEVVPKFIRDIYNLIELEIENKGVFRESGNNNMIKKAENELMCGNIPNFNSMDTSELTSVFKSYFRNLSEPLIPEDILNEILQSELTVENIKPLIESIPELNRTVLTFVMHCLHKVTKYASSNMMKPNTLSISTSHSILWFKDGEKSFNTAIINLMEFLLLNFHQIFSKEDILKVGNRLVSEPPNQFPKRSEFTCVEDVEITHYLFNKPDEKTWRRSACRFILEDDPYSKVKYSDVILVIGKKTLYFFQKGGKIQLEIHYFDLIALKSCLDTLEICFSEGIAFRELNLKPYNTFSWDAEIAVFKILKKFKKSFLFVNALPSISAQLSEYSEIIGITESISSYQGFKETYLSVCEYLQTPPKELVLWDLENSLQINQIKHLDVSNYLSDVKVQITELKVIMKSIRLHKLFDSISFSDIKLSQEQLQIIADAFKGIRGIKSLALRNVGPVCCSSAFAELFEVLATTSGKWLCLERLDVSFNIWEEKSTLALSIYLANSNLKHLEMECCQFPKKGLISVLNSISNQKVCQLEYLNLSGCIHKGAEFNTILTNLFQIESLKVLNISECLIDWSAIDTFFYTSIEELCLSNCKVNIAQQSSFVHVISRFQTLKKLNLSGIQLTIRSISSVINPMETLTTLDFSYVEMTNDSFTKLVKLLQNLRCMPLLKELVINQVFSLQSKEWIAPLTLFAQLLSSRPIRALSMRGGSKSQLKDISGHKAGSSFFVALSNYILTNKFLQNLSADDNGLTLANLRVINNILNYNPYIRFNVPILDISNILKSGDANVEELIFIVNQIQNRNIVENKMQKDGITSPTFAKSILRTISRKDSKNEDTLHRFDSKIMEEKYKKLTEILKRMSERDMMISPENKNIALERSVFTKKMV